MNTGLHESLSLAGSPCVGVCSTSVMPDDDRCQGCGRTVEEIRDWAVFSEFNKKIINVKNWLEGYNIRQKIEIRMSNTPKIEDIKGRLITIQSLIEMTGQDILDYFGKDPAVKDAYQSLVQSREEILKTKQTLPYLD
jgi:predicted Fe-S protein YdhL (DUF1289 family)